jgi:hypothetical protein
MTIKPCTRCGIAKPLEEFSREARTADGYRVDCKECCRESKTTSFRALGFADAPCFDCVFLRKCQANIWKADWWPFCFPVSKQHKLFLKKYADNGNAMARGLDKLDAGKKTVAREYPKQRGSVEGSTATGGNK